VATFSVRAWLAEQIGCPLDQLTAIDIVTAEGFEATFARAGAPYGHVRLLFASEPGSGQGRGLVAAWGQGRSASTVVPAGDRVRW
jgi:hypothetical protein